MNEKEIIYTLIKNNVNKLMSNQYFNSLDADAIESISRVIEAYFHLQSVTYTPLFSTLSSLQNPSISDIQHIINSYSILNTNREDRNVFLRAIREIIKENSDNSNLSSCYNDLDNAYVDNEVTYNLASMYDYIEAKLFQKQISPPLPHSTTFPAKLTFSDAINLFMLFLTILSLYLGSKPDSQLEELIDIQKQELEILREINEQQTGTLNELTEKITLLTETVENLKEDSSPESSDTEENIPELHCASGCNNN